MVVYLIILAILAFAFLVMMFINYRRVSRSGLPEQFRFLRIIFSWILIFVMVGSIGGAAYAATHSGNKTETKVVKKATKSKKSNSASMDETLDVTFSKKKPVLGADGTVAIKMYVPSKTSVKIIGHNSRTVYKTFAAGTKNKTQAFKYTFKDAGTYDIELTRGDTSVTKTIEVTSPESSSSSSSESSVTSEDSSVTSDDSSVSNSNTGSGYSGGTSYYYSSSDQDSTPTPDPTPDPEPTPDPGDDSSSEGEIESPSAGARAFTLNRDYI